MEFIKMNGDMGACYGIEDDMYVISVEPETLSVRGLAYAGQNKSTEIEVTHTDQRRRDLPA